MGGGLQVLQRSDAATAQWQAPTSWGRVNRWCSCGHMIPGESATRH